MTKEDIIRALYFDYKCTDEDECIKSVVCIDCIEKKLNDYEQQISVKAIEIGKKIIIGDLNEIIQLNTMSHYLTKEDLYKSVYEKICKYLNEQLKEQ